MKIKIKHGTKLPPKVAYPLDKMKVEDSFEFPYEKHSSVRAVCSRYARANKPVTFRVRRITEEAGVCVRVR